MSVLLEERAFPRGFRVSDAPLFQRDLSAFKISVASTESTGSNVSIRLSQRLVQNRAIGRIQPVARIERQQFQLGASGKSVGSLTTSRPAVTRALIVMSQESNTVRRQHPPRNNQAKAAGGPRSGGE